MPLFGTNLLSTRRLSYSPRRRRIHASRKRPLTSTIFSRTRRRSSSGVSHRKLTVNRGSTLLISSRPKMTAAPKNRSRRSQPSTQSRSLKPFTSSGFDSQYEFLTTGWGQSPTVSLNEGTQLEWPKEMGPVLVISIRPERMAKFSQRMGPWMKHMRRFPATDGRLINPRKWALTKKVVQSKMTPGRMGCYDSHVRIWETIARSPHEVVTVLEDDVDWDYSNAKSLLTHMAQCFSELKTISWDWLAWGHGPWAFDKNHPIPNLKHWRKPGTCQGFFAYTLTRSMAQKLLTKCYPYKNQAVDKWFYDEFIHQVPVNVFTVEPRMCWVVSGESDTSKKRL